ncbi:MAG: S8 family serine peptidase [Lachnospiraceae bacterium]|nr:S8 family serine peptidase [Lachnospiraceae bacterium]
MGYDQGERTWEVIVRYSGSYQELLAVLPAVPEPMESVALSGGYAILTATRNQIEALAALPQIEYVEKPRRLYFSVLIGRTASCVYALQTAPYDLFGEGVLVAVIDSGVDYFHPDFRKEDGSTRIRAIWDQSAVLPANRVQEAADDGVTNGEIAADAGATNGETANGEAADYLEEAGREIGDWDEQKGAGKEAGQLGHIPAGFTRGVEYTQGDINAALAAGSRAAGLALVPEQDFSGHGTEVLGIAAGNGRASGNPYRGIAAKSDI